MESVFAALKETHPSRLSWSSGVSRFCFSPLRVNSQAELLSHLSDSDGQQL
jgi:hypothetical protein